MKTIVLSLPYDDDHSFLITGSEKDKSVVAEIENNNGFYEIGNMKLLEHVIDKDFVCVDVGANIGVVSLVLSHLAPEGRIYSFEPCKMNF